MANSKIKASVHVDEEDPDWVHGIELQLTDSQSAEVLRAVVQGATLSINLVTAATHAGIGNGQKTSEKFDYAT